MCINNNAVGEDTETVCGRDCQHPPGVVSIWIHTEEQLKPEYSQQLFSQSKDFLPEDDEKKEDRANMCILLYDVTDVKK